MPARTTTAVFVLLSADFDLTTVAPLDDDAHAFMVAGKATAPAPSAREPSSRRDVVDVSVGARFGCERSNREHERDETSHVEDV